jgi:hypothetical protein
MDWSTSLRIPAGKVCASKIPSGPPNGVVTATLSLQDARYQTYAQVNKLFDQSLERIRELPGVEAAAVGLALPYERGINSNFQLPGGRPEDDHTAVEFYVTPEYFRALRIPLLGGRACVYPGGWTAGSESE